MTCSPERADGGGGSRPGGGVRETAPASPLQPRRAARAAGAPEPGEIIAVGTRASGDGRIRPIEAPRPGEPMLRWLSNARTIDEIEKELGRIWAQPDLVVDVDGGRPGRHIAARTSVMNLVVLARQPEVGERAAETIGRLTGRHPSRTMIVLSADPDGPPWLDARIQAHCVLPRADAPETCSELIYLTAGGETGRHLTALVAPLLIHDLPVTTWWPGEPSLGTEPTDDVLDAHGPPGGGRLRLGRRWPGATPPARTPLRRSTSASRSATSRWSASRAGARRSPRSSTCPSSSPTSPTSAGSR